MSETTSSGLGDLLGLLGANNPFASVGKSVAQFQKGVGEFLVAMERFNETMDQLNGVAQRVSNLLDTVEEPIKAFVPQVTRTVRAADTIVEQMASMPRDLAAFMEVLGELARRLQPLGQMAETLFPFRGLRPAAPAPAPKKAAAKKAPAKKKS
jgi:ABC-type transporter Mla subunit MlaD